MRVLVVDDDEDLRELLERALVRDGHVVTSIANGADVEPSLRTRGADVVVLDHALPDTNGVDVCRALRSNGIGVPILMLTAHSEITRRVAALDAGVDDFLGKPFAVAELCARVRALARRRNTTYAMASLSRKSLHIDFASRKAAREADPIEMTPREWALLESLALRHGKVVPRSELLVEVWGEVSDATSASLDVLVNRIRRKLSSDVIRTVRNEGYALENDG